MPFSFQQNDKSTVIHVSAAPDRVWTLLAPEYINCRGFSSGPCHLRETDRVVQEGISCIIRQKIPELQIKTELLVRAADDVSVELDFSITNESQTAMEDAVADFCFSCGGGLSTSADAIDKRGIINTAFSGPLKERNKEWTRRTLVPTNTGLTVVGDTNVYFPVAIHRRMVPSQNLVDIPIILCQSADYQETYAAGWECVYALYCAVGYCIHTMVWLGTIPAGQSVLRKGRFYYMKSDPYTVLARFQRDFPNRLPHL